MPLTERLKRNDGDDHDDGAEDSGSGDKSDDDLDETVMEYDARDNDEDEDTRPEERRKYVLTFKDVEDAIDKFSGDDGKNINQWIREFEDLVKLCGWSMVHQTIYARRLLVGSARLFVNHEVRGKPWKDIKAALKSEFAPRLDSHAVHMKLQRRKKKQDETYHQYCYKMLEIASPINMETSAIIQYIIDGITDDEVNKTILYGAKTISQLKTKLDMYELMKARNKHVGNVKIRADDIRKKQAQDKTGEKTEIRRCYNCGGKNHVSATCPSKEKSVLCFQCNEHGHIAANCPQPKKTEKSKKCNAIQDKVESNPKVICDRSKRIYKLVEINNSDVTALFDSGSDISLMRAAFYVKIGAPSLVKQTIKFCGIGATENVTLGRVCMGVGIDGEHFEVDFHVVSDALLNDDVLIGSDFLSNVDARIRGGKIISITKIVKEPDESLFVNRININSEVSDIDLTHVSNQDHRKQLQQIISDYKPQKTEDVGIKLQIVVKDDVPIYQRARRLAPQELEIVDSQIQEWLQKGIIQSSYSNYVPLYLLKRKMAQRDYVLITAS
ncbi:PREDICTED: uncharacterized protein LOC105451915 [Wasmannia auropunctata]|uniref:uncharacterized protein LOC105451915 n=1 Tax=Wasmannia auropunctata TaxID=64793 RepID=UPI0005F04FB8|nr:PREDICTED: uncharacterized protein LOC105451915 [Wasmannia auropunctata]